MTDNPNVMHSLYTGAVAQLKHKSVSDTSPPKMPRNVILLHRLNWAGGTNETYWVLFHTVTGLKKYFCYIWAPAGKTRITAFMHQGNFFSVFPLVFGEYLKYYLR